MRFRLIQFALLPALAVGCAHVVGTGGKSQDVLLSFPNRLKPGEMIVGFEVTVTNGKIVALNKAPVDWLVNITAAWWDSTITGTPGHGASAFQDIAPLKRFLTLHKDRPEFDVTGSLVVTTDFSNMTTNFFRKSDFLFEEIVTTHEVGRTATSRLGSEIVEKNER